MASPLLLAKAASLLLPEEENRTIAGWIAATVLAPFILVTIILCVLGTGTADNNVSLVERCFYPGSIPASVSDDCRSYITQMRLGFARLDCCITDINAQMEDNARLDSIRVKAVFYALYFGGDSPDAEDCQKFVDCFVVYEEQENREDGEEETLPVAVLLNDLEQIYRNIQLSMNCQIAASQKVNAENIYRLIRYGRTDGVVTGAPFIGADGFCSPIGEDWRNRVTSEFGNRRDPITGERKGHTGMDLAVPTGTSVRAALPGRVVISKYSSSYGYYVKIEHENGLSTLYAHCSRLLADVGQVVETGDVVALSGSTGRSTGPHLHFEVRINDERTDPRSYLP